MTESLPLLLDRARRGDRRGRLVGRGLDRRAIFLEIFEATARADPARQHRQVRGGTAGRASGCAAGHHAGTAPADCPRAGAVHPRSG